MFPVHHKKSIAAATGVILFILTSYGVHLSYKGNIYDYPT